MPYFGDILEDSVITIPWNTNGVDGASITRAANGTPRVYKEDNTTERTGGEITDTEDLDGKTGCHQIKIDTSADAFYEVGKRYHVMVDAMTIDGKTVNHFIGTFSIELHKPKVNVVQVDGASLGTHQSGHFPADLRYTAGAALATAGSGYVPADLRQAGGSAITSSGGRPEVNVSHFGGSAGTFASGRPQVNASHIAGQAILANAGTNLNSYFDADDGSWSVTAAANLLYFWGNDGSPIGAYASDYRVGLREGAIDSDSFVTAAIGASAFNAGAIDANVLANGCLTEAKFAADTAKYQAKVWLIDDDAGTTDRWIVAWFKNGQPVLASITSPTFQLIKASDGGDHIASSAMTEIGTTELYKYDATSGERITAGAGYVAKVQATIDGSTRTWTQPVGRDST